MRYYEKKPAGHAANYVRLYWELVQARDEATSKAEPVLPDGCVEIIFDLKDRFRTFRNDGAVIDQPRSIVAGQLTSRIMIGPSGDTEMFGVRLQPHSAFPLLGVAMHEFRDRIVDLADVIGNIESLLFERIEAARSFAERVSIFEESFIGNAPANIDAQFSHCISMMLCAYGAVPVAECARNLGWSERRLERVFNEQIGMRPKLYSRIVRFKTFLDAVDSGRPMLLDKALAAGYHDQSHMIRDFKSFAAMTPTQYFGTDLAFGDLFSGRGRDLSDFYNTGAHLTS